jgi:hypothetical protein
VELLQLRQDFTEHVLRRVGIIRDGGTQQGH